MRSQFTRKTRVAVALLALPVMQFAPLTAFAEDGPPAGEPRAIALPEDRPVVAMGGAIVPEGQRLRTLAGDVDPLKGMIRTFDGSLDPFVGRIRTFEGEIDPLIGRIRTFAGDIDPYKGLIRTFWGDLTPVQGELDPSMGRIRTFSDAFVPQSRELLTLWASSEATGDYTQMAARLQQMEREGAAQWEAQVIARTGSDFATGFSTRFLADWKVDLARPASLAGWAPIDRQRFLLDWYDSVLGFSGMDRVDHWMNAVNWSPALTQTQGGGSQAVIGLVDFFAANDADVRSKVVYSGGYQNVDNAHGAAVGSLIVASHDGRGVMGIAPRAKVAAYNPFDSTLTASWEDVKTGITQVGQRGASVINLSLGVPGLTLPTEWRDVFRTSAIDSFKDKTIYVIAAGNDGAVQQSNIEMNGALDSTFLVVGSVDPNGQISAFSNTPGTACLTDGGRCKNTEAFNTKNPNFRKNDYLKESGLLMNRFLVAPGEMILVSDGAGGVTRMSGTSFAAPLVSGAIALIQDRWPWLKNFPRDVAKVLLESAQDLGAPGVDPIYGHGLLDIEAAQSTLDFGALKYYLVNGSSTSQVNLSTLRSGGIKPIWSTNNMYFSAFEKIDAAERDFLIPLSSRLFGSSVNGRMFQEHMYTLFNAWMAGGATFAERQPSLTDSVPALAIRTPAGWAMSMRGRYSTVVTEHGERRKLNSTLAMESPDGRFAFALGRGDGASMLAGQTQLQMSSDYDPYLGGANPLLGFASGGAHLATRLGLGRQLDVSFGVTRQRRSIEEDLAGLRDIDADRLVLSRLDDYKAQATNIRFDYRPTAALTLSAAYTLLKEEGAFFGVRSLESADFAGGTSSDGLTVSADLGIGAGFSLFGAATGSRSNSHNDAALDVRNALGSAYQVGFAKSGVFGTSDRLRVTMAQPLNLEQGEITLQSIGVIDRETGEKGIVTQRVDILNGVDRRYRLEALYAAPLFAGAGELNLFGSAELRQVRSEIPTWTVGGNFRLGF